MGLRRRLSVRDPPGYSAKHSQPETEFSTHPQGTLVVISDRLPGFGVDQDGETAAVNH